MQLHVVFDDELLLKYHQRNSPLFFEIYFENEGKFYPEEHHMDFGEVILYWWITETIDCIEKHKLPKFIFMEGNYQLITGVDKATGLLSTNVGLVSLLHEGMDMLQEATRKVIDKKKELGLATVNLEASLSRLEDLMTDCTF